MTKWLHLLILQSMYTGFVLSLNFFFLKKLLYRWELSPQGTSIWSPMGHWERLLPLFVLRPVVPFTRVSLTSRERGPALNVKSST